MSEAIKASTSGKRIYISDPDETAPASPAANFALWAVLIVAALVAIFLA